MGVMNVMVVLSVLVRLIVPLALLVALQVWLCRKGKRLGLILPGLSLLLSIVLCLSMAAFTVRAGGGAVQVYDENGNLVKEEQMQQIENEDFGLKELLPVAGVFLVSNIPTVIYGGIWLYYKNRRDWKNEVQRMTIQDLE